MNQLFPTRPNQTALRVMVVDDDAFMLDYISAAFDELGTFDIVIESDSKRGLWLLQQTRPDLLVCDLAMPGMDGIEFLRLAASTEFRGGVILHSGMDLSVRVAAERLAKAHGLHVLGAFEKPLNRSALVAALGRLGNRQSIRRTQEYADRLSAEDMRDGLLADRVEIYFQPKVLLEQRQMVGVECLARWRHPTRGLLPPAAFIPLIEEYGLIDELTLLILRKGTAQLGRWLRDGYDFKIAVNVSMDNLNRLDLPEIFQAISTEAGVPPTHIVLEMTETRLMDNFLLSLEILTRLRLKGFHLSIDDFGTGFSTMENLKQLPFSELKIDRAFVDGASKDHAARMILESSVRLGKIFNLNLVAEGVETQEDWNLVASSGCDQVQGYFVAKPMKADDLIEWKNSWEKMQHPGVSSDRSFHAIHENKQAF
ncbi:EAL domain-containing protein [Duganella sp. FT135W]|uniref:EAL domain-containing protein n=1 Tax=Duganella flavida TaxID=2692175 RepID=A0A6L8K6J3_9BURK|nr:EAL domain-containing response regulator [Duganella flavida]MYM22167.1 EAL domain-containing protein [Duganella flavida]